MTNIYNEDGTNFYRSKLRMCLTIPLCVAVLLILIILILPLFLSYPVVTTYQSTVSLPVVFNYDDSSWISKMYKMMIKDSTNIQTQFFPHLLLNDNLKSIRLIKQKNQEHLQFPKEVSLFIKQNY